MGPASWIAARVESRSVTSDPVPTQLWWPSLTAMWPRPTTRQRSGSATSTYASDSWTPAAPSWLGSSASSPFSATGR
jgi:hypothetical protein